ncbi:pollen-specific leucine-rich repeat extensin-like protein 3 isoform X2 [Canna indica]|uniref:Pollen-specific leucine-rich repeat extensin-like protein 3 isoform X2 n=1 Tax=Canna indica TaxID=4628 RepID=A0AAQ3K0C3_9LILI|nr:pollen-specific leucine-rich repeat extensin-like protein 3 isoform X2 [Canna indica]
MEYTSSKDFTAASLLFITLVISSAFIIIPCEGGRSLPSEHSEISEPRERRMMAVSHLDGHYATSDPYYYEGTPMSLPPYGDVMSPSASPEDYPPFCIYPPFTPFPPSTTPFTPIPFPPPESTNPPVFTPNPPEYPVPSPPEAVPNPPEVFPNPPPEVVPNPPVVVPGPPGYEPSPPVYVPSPTGFVPSPPPPLGFVPSPPVFLPPVVYPPPTAPPSPTVGSRGLWCVAKPTVPDPIIQEAMNYACGSGADCDSIQPNGSCYQPDTLIAHASFAFNSYWQRTKVAGATCDFGGTAMLVTKDPSYDGCRFIIF